MSMSGAAAKPDSSRPVDARRLERVLRLRHQHPRQPAGADRAAALRAEDAGQHRVRAHPAGARADDVPVARSTTRGSPTGWRKSTGRTDVCALPSGISVPHMFIVTFVIMLPIALKTGDPIKGWEAGLIWVFIQSFVLMIGGFVAPVHPQDHAARGAARHARRRVDHVHLDASGAGDVHDAGDRSDRVFAIILVSWFGGVKYPRGIPAGLVAIAVGTLIAWGSNRVRPRTRRHERAKASATPRSPTSASPCRCRPSSYVFSGFEFLGVILVTAIPVRHLRPRRGDGQRRERGSRRRRIPDDARADRRRRRQPDRLPDGQSLHQRRLHRPSRLEGDGRTHRLLGRDRHHGDRALVVRHHLADAVADPGRRDLADPALHRHADRRAGVPGDAEVSMRPRSCSRFTPHLAAWAKLQIDNALNSARQPRSRSAGSPPTRPPRSRRRRSHRCRRSACSTTGSR